MRVQVQPYCPFGRDTSWITQDVVEAYIYAWIKGHRFAEYCIAKYAQGDPIRMRTFREVVFDDPDFEDLKEQIWAEMELPTPGSIEYHIWNIERQLEDPTLPPAELSKLYKVLGEYRGWLTKPGEKAASIQLINNVGTGENGTANIASMNANEAERLYYSLIAQR